MDWRDVLDAIIKTLVGITAILLVIFTVGSLVVYAPGVLILLVVIVIAYMVGTVIVEEFF